MSPQAIYDVLKKSYPQLIATERKSPDGWSFWLGEPHRGPNPNRIFHCNRASAHGQTMVRLPVTKRVIRDQESYIPFNGNEADLRRLVDNELRLYREHFEARTGEGSRRRSPA